MTLTDTEWNDVLDQLEAHGIPRTTRWDRTVHTGIVMSDKRLRHTNHFWSDTAMQTRATPLGPRYWLWLSAVALGTFLGLWCAYHG